MDRLFILKVGGGGGGCFFLFWKKTFSLRKFDGKIIYVSEMVKKTILREFYAWNTLFS